MLPDYGARLYICGKVNRIMDSGKERAEAFEKVFREWYPRLCAYAATIVRDGEEARDIVSQVFLRLWEKERNLEWGPGVRPYLFQCVYNAALNFIRAEKVRCRFFEFLRRDMEEGGGARRRGAGAAAGESGGADRADAGADEGGVPSEPLRGEDVCGDSRGDGGVGEDGGESGVPGDDVPAGAAGGLVAQRAGAAVFGGGSGMSRCF